MSFFLNSSAICLLACFSANVQAFAADNGAAIELKKLTDESSALSEQKNQVLQAYQLEAKACWQYFAVNDCLAKARREKYQRLAPIEQLEIALNAKRRQFKESERVQRLNEKASLGVDPSDKVKAVP